MKKKSWRIAPTILFFLLAGPATEANETLFTPGLCSLNNAVALIENPTLNEETIAIRSLFFIEGIHRPLAPQSRWTLHLKDLPGFAEAPSTALQIVRSQKNVKIEIYCQGLQMAASNVVSPHQQILLPKRTQELELTLLNLHHKSQDIQIYGRQGDGTRTLLNTSHLAARYVETKLKIVTREPYLTALEIVGAGRLLSRGVLGDEGLGLNFTHRVLLPEGFAVVTEVATETAYFLVSHASQDQHYVLPITDPALAAQARELVRAGERKIVSAEVRPSQSWLNRNFSGDSAPWSWEVTHFYGFTDFGSLLCDGNPQMIEDLILARQGPICFWSYHLNRELSREEVQTGHLLLGAK